MRLMLYGLLVAWVILAIRSDMAIWHALIPVVPGVTALVIDWWK